MEEKFSVKDSDNAAIRKFSELLKDSRIAKDYEYYYKEGVTAPYFKISKPFLKENDSDPDESIIYVDIDGEGDSVEYSLYMEYASDHFVTAEECMDVVEKLYFGEYVEVALVTPKYAYACIIENTGDPAENAKALSESIGPVMNLFENNEQPIKGAHMHIIFPLSVTNNLVFQRGEIYAIPGVEMYIVSAEFAIHNEYYVIK